MRKFLAMILCLAMVLTFAVPFASAAEQRNSEDIVILYTNDVHTYIDGALAHDVIAGVKAELKKQYENVLLADAGDHIQGTAFGSMDKGKTIIDLMNAMVSIPWQTPGKLYSACEGLHRGTIFVDLDQPYVCLTDCMKKKEECDCG